VPLVVVITAGEIDLSSLRAPSAASAAGRWLSAFCVEFFNRLITILSLLGRDLDGAAATVLLDDQEAKADHLHRSVPANLATGTRHSNPTGNRVMDDGALTSSAHSGGDEVLPKVWSTNTYAQDVVVAFRIVPDPP
jgi:hypothetical protein